MSLVALDALAAFNRYDTLLLKELQPRLTGPVDGVSFRETLEEYAGADPVPRVNRVVATILNSADAILARQATGETP
jgi:hypothetical protein